MMDMDKRFAEIRALLGGNDANALNLAAVNLLDDMRDEIDRLRQRLQGPILGDGFDRYMAISPQNVAVWESGFAAGTCEDDEWYEFVEWSHEVLPTDAKAELANCEDIFEAVEKLKSWGWRMVQCRPVEVE